MTAITPTLDMSVTVDVGSISANSTLDVNFTVPGAVPGMFFRISAPSTLNSGVGIVNTVCEAAGVVKVRFMNATGGAIDPASMVFSVLGL